MQCSLAHCSVCRYDRPDGPFFVCEFCVRSRVCAFSIDYDSISTVPLHHGSSLRRACLSYLGPIRTCVHSGFTRNDLVDTLFLLIKPHEIIAGARCFLDFYLNATWHDLFAPLDLKDLRAQGKMQELWPSFYQIFIQNSQCPRVRLITYALQCALNTGPVLRGEGSRVPTNAREIFMQGDLKSRYNDHGLRKCIYPRVLAAADFAHGLFEKEIMRTVAIRVFKFIHTGDFNTSAQCCCASLEGAKVPFYRLLECRGPVLDLCVELGQAHHFNPKGRLPNDVRLLVWSQIKNHQSKLRHIIAQRNFRFDSAKHHKLPGSTVPHTDENRFLA